MVQYSKLKVNPAIQFTARLPIMHYQHITSILYKYIKVVSVHLKKNVQPKIILIGCGGCDITDFMQHIVNMLIAATYFYEKIYTNPALEITGNVLI